MFIESEVCILHSKFYVALAYKSPVFFMEFL